MSDNTTPTIGHRHSHPLTADIVLENLTVGYERHPAVHHLSVRLPAGSLVAIVGPNGAGKSTLLKALTRRVALNGGKVSGIDIDRLAYLPQIPDIDRSFPISVREFVMTGLWREVGALGWWRREHRARTDHALAAVGLQGFEQRTLDTLSGGQFQRTLFARMMLQDAPVLLLDEPFSAVDQRTTDDLLGLMHRWHHEGRTLVVVLHDLATVRAHFPTTLLLARELVAFGATETVLTPQNLARARGRQEAFEDHAPVCDVPESPGSLALAQPHSHVH
ncbi:MAG: metal ABC transporter ATP-binding protein [Burkholderiaceae bacterium]|nr:metal ABC transporter ATP-binding protein [Burkholderiaceae bacterium]